MNPYVRGVAILVFLVTVPMRLFAQGTNDRHWGIAASVTPKWQSQSSLTKIIDGGDGTFQGSDLTVGFVRGSARGGDWGVSFVQKPFKDGLISTVTENDCQTIPGPTAINYCSLLTEKKALHDVALRGVEYHVFKPFATIKRVQLGVNIGAGVATWRGSIEETQDFRVEQTGRPVMNMHQVNTEEAKEEFFHVMPLLKLEAQAAVMAARGFKVKISGGLNFPSTSSFRIGAVMLVGAK